MEKKQKYGMTEKHLKIVLLFVLLLAVFLCPKSAWAANESKIYGSYIYKISNNKVEILKYKGKQKFVKIPSKIGGKKVISIGEGAFKGNQFIRSVTVPDTITSIAAYAFDECGKLKEIKLSKNLKRIGEHAFARCVNLEQITIPALAKELENSVFYSCTALKNVKIKAKLEIIPSDCFGNCKNLKSVKIPNTVKEIGQAAFAGCESLTQIDLPNSVAAVEYEAFSNCTSLKKISLPGSLTEISSWMFYNCCQLEEIELPESVTSVGSFAFYNCKKAKIKHLPKSLKYIGRYAFYQCEKLEKIDLSDGVESIDAWAFAECSSVERIHLPSSLSKMEANPFAGCTNTKQFTVEADNPLLREKDGILYTKENNQIFCFTNKCKYEGNYTLPKEESAVLPMAFSCQNRITSVTIPKTVKKLSDYYFMYASSILSITFPERMEELGEFVFCKTGITSVKIPEGVKILELGALRDCKNLTSIYLPSTLTSLNAEVEEFNAAIIGCKELKKITVSTKNKHLYTKNGVLYKRLQTGDAIICYPAARPGETFTLGKNISLGTYAFSNCKYLKKLFIKEGVDYIGCPFYQCDGLVVQIPKSVKRFISEGHETEFPIFTLCENCSLEVYKNSAMHKQCKKLGIPYKLIK